MARLLALPFVLLVLPAILAQPQSYPPPPGTKIENARVNPPGWQLNTNCEVDVRAPSYKPYYNLHTFTNNSLIYRLAMADVTSPMNNDLVAAFEAYWAPAVNISTYGYGSGAVGLCLAGNVSAPVYNLPYCDMAVISREIAPISTSSTELANFVKKYGYQPMEVPVWSGSYNALGFEDTLLFFVNSNNPLRNITLQQLDAILSTTRNRGYPNAITTWDQLGITDPTFAGQQILVQGSTLGNGFNVFMNRAVMLAGQWNTAILNQSATVFPIGSLVSAQKYSLGFSGVSYLNQSGVPEYLNILNIAWDKSCAPVVLSPNTLCTREWPLSRFGYFYANVAPGKTLDPVLYEYLNYMLSYEGQQIIREAQGGMYFPLPYDVLMATRAKYLVVNNPPAFVDGAGSVYYSQNTAFCKIVIVSAAHVTSPMSTVIVLLALLSWMAAAMK